MRLISSTKLTERDWDDLLSPVLIKELRQGLREPAFVISFIALQAGLAFLIFIGLGSDLDPESLTNQTLLFQGALFLTFLVALPLRGMTSLSQERRQNTLDTILLTRLSARGVVYGKWIALVFQGFLLATTVLPYIMIRYLTGGEELVSNLMEDVILFWGFLLVSAICVGLSAINMVFSRIASFVALVITVAIMSFSYGSMVPSSSGSLFDSFSTILSWGVLYLIFLPIVVFDLAAASVGSVIEGGVLRRRLTITLFLLLLCFLQAFAPLDLLFVAGLGCVIGACVLEIGQNPEIKERNLESFVRHGILGKALALIFLPGWQSGLIYFLLTFGLCLAAALIYPLSGASLDFSDTLAWGVALVGSVLIPLSIILIFFRSLRMRCFLIAFINVLALAACGILQAVFSATPLRPLDIFTFFPSVATLLTGEMLYNGINASEEMGFIIKGGAVDIFLLGILMVSSIPWLKSFDVTWQMAKVNPLGNKINLQEPEPIKLRA